MQLQPPPGSSGRHPAVPTTHAEHLLRGALSPLVARLLIRGAPYSVVRAAIAECGDDVADAAFRGDRRGCVDL